MKRANWYRVITIRERELNKVTFLCHPPRPPNGGVYPKYLGQFTYVLPANFKYIEMYILRLLAIYSPIWGSGGPAIGKDYSFLEPIASEFWESGTGSRMSLYLFYVPKRKDIF
jgi:hypothetical protein